MPLARPTAMPKLSPPLLELLFIFVAFMSPVMAIDCSVGGDGAKKHGPSYVEEKEHGPLSFVVESAREECISLSTKIVLGAVDDEAAVDVGINVGEFVVDGLALGASLAWCNPNPQSIVFSSSVNSKHTVRPVSGLIVLSVNISLIPALFVLLNTYPSGGLART